MMQKKGIWRQLSYTGKLCWLLGKSIVGRRSRILQPRCPLSHLKLGNIVVERLDSLTPDEVQKMLQHYNVAVEKGLPTASYNLGVAYRDGKVVPKDYSKAVEHFRKAADAGHPIAQRNMGIMYLEGKGVKSEAAKAKQWFEKAEASGDDGARAWLDN